MTDSLSRPVIFTVVGVLGFVCQLAVLYLLTSTGLPVGLSTAAAVTAAVAHNFLWHRRWTWRDRTSAARTVPVQFVRFAGLNGLVSLIGGVAITSGLAASGVSVLAANVVAVISCSVVNFLLADRLVFLAGLAMVVAAPPLGAAVLEARTVTAWDEYVRLTEKRISTEEPNGAPPRLSADEWRRLKAGELLLSRRSTKRPDGTDADVPDGAIHHWVGRVYLPGVQLDAVLRELQAPTSRRWVPSEVLSMRVAPDGTGGLRVTMRVERQGIVDVTYDMVHAVRYARHAAGHATSRSESRRIVEIDEPGTPRERARPEGDDHGFVWRLNAYWRYLPVEGGVLVECESLALSRSVPLVVRALAGPIITRVSRESLENTLTALRRGFAAPRPVASRPAAIWTTT